MLGTVVNAGAIILGGSIGLVLKKGLPKRFGNQVMNGLALCVLYIGISGTLQDIGISGTLQAKNVLMLILSMVIGTLIGELLDLDERVTQLGNWLENKFKSKDEYVSISEGFVSASLLFCVGAMAIVGALQDGLKGDTSMLYTKAMLDGISALIFSTSLGVGVILSSVLVLIYQGGITFLASLMAPFLTDMVIAEMTGVGSLLIIGLALNMLRMTNLKLMNFVPAIFIPILLSLIM